MAKRPRRKQAGAIGTLMVELSALAGILGVTQPTVRDNLWQMVQPATINSPAKQLSPQAFGEFVTQPESYASSVYETEANQATFPSAYTAQAVIPRNERTPAIWNASGYNPMGTYQ